MKIILNKITYKIFMLISSVMIVMLVILSCVNYYIAKDRLYARLELQGYTLLEGLNYSLEALLLANNLPPIQRLLSNIAASKEIIAVSVVNRDQTIIADSDPEEIGMKENNSKLIAQVLKTEKPMTAYVTESNGLKNFVLIRPLRGKEYSIKLQTDVIGVIYLELSTAYINARLEKDFLLNLFVITLLSVIMFFYTIIILRKIIIKPIKLIEHYTNLIAKGNLNIKIPKTSHDEIGQLTDHLNTMTSELSKLTYNLGRTNSYLESIYSSMSNMLFVTDENYYIKQVNKTTKTLLKFEEHELIDHSIYDFIITTLNNTLENQHLIKNQEIKFLTKNGDSIITLTSSSIVKDTNDVIQGIVFVAQDLTEYKQFEEKIHEAKEAIIISRQAGMAEIANNVLHNIGNVLNSVNTSADLLESNLKNSKLNFLPKLENLLQKNTDNLADFFTQNPKGKLLPSYIRELSQHWQHENQFNIQECEALVKSIQHIKEIVNMQQSIAGTYGVIEKIAITELIEDAINIVLYNLQAEHIKIIREYDELDPVYIDKSKLLQILINLIKNAKEALLASSNDEKILIIRLQSYNKNTLQIQISDNGIGISPENIPMLFTQGFTTKPKGHGFGLHSSIFAANELQGSLTVVSDGLMKGATFTLQFPYRRIPSDVPA